MGQFIFFDDDGRTVAVEDSRIVWLLRQDEASLRRCRIDGHDENNHVAAMNESLTMGASASAGFNRASFSFNSWMPSPVKALT